MSDEYYVKYLKYKNKYISLKSMIGGSDTIKASITLLKTHFLKYADKNKLDRIDFHLGYTMFTELQTLYKEIEKWKGSHSGATKDDFFKAVGITADDFNYIQLIYLRTCFYANDGTLSKTKKYHQLGELINLKTIAFNVLKLLDPKYDINFGLCKTWKN
jgi:hypothetical protein